LGGFPPGLVCRMAGKSSAVTDSFVSKSSAPLSRSARRRVRMARASSKASATISRTLRSISRRVASEQSRGHADELRPCAEKSTRAVAVERLDMNSPVPPGTNDLSQSLRIVLILHPEGGACVPGTEKNDLEPEIADTSHGAIAPVSIPMRASSPACRRTKTPICSGTVGTGSARVCGQHGQRRKSPSSSVKRPIQQSGSLMTSDVRITGNAARIAALSADQAPTAIIGFRAHPATAALLSRQSAGQAKPPRPATRFPPCAVFLPGIRIEVGPVGNAGADLEPTARGVLPR
jgi:hypothetical protein